MQRTFAITGMTCAHCARTVEDTLNALSGVRAEVSYAARRAHVELTNGVDEAAVVDAVRAKGYDAQPQDAERTPPSHQSRPITMGVGSTSPS